MPIERELVIGGGMSPSAIVINGAVRTKLRALQTQAYSGGGVVVLKKWDSLHGYQSVDHYRKLISQLEQQLFNTNPLWTPPGTTRTAFVVSPFRNPVGSQTASASISSGTLGQEDSYMQSGEHFADKVTYVGDVGYSTSFPSAYATGPFGSCCTHWSSAAGNYVQLTLDRGYRFRAGARQTVTITAVAGTYTMTIGDGLGNNVVTAAIAFNASASTVQSSMRTALATIPNFVDDSVIVGGSYAGGYTIQFTGAAGGASQQGLATRDIPLITLSGGVGTGTVVETVIGGVGASSNELDRAVTTVQIGYYGGAEVVTGKGLADIYGKPIYSAGTTQRTSVAGTVGILTVEVRLADGTLVSTTTLNPATVTLALGGSYLSAKINLPDLATPINNQTTYVRVIFPTTGTVGFFSHFVLRDSGTAGVEVLDYSVSGLAYQDMRQFQNGVDGAQRSTFDLPAPSAQAHYSNTLEYAQGTSSAVGTYTQVTGGGTITVTGSGKNRVYTNTTGNLNGIVNAPLFPDVISVDMGINDLRAQGMSRGAYKQMIVDFMECIKKNNILAHFSIEPAPLADGNGSYYTGTAVTAQTYCIQKFSIIGFTGGTFTMTIPTTALGAGGTTGAINYNSGTGTGAGTIRTAMAAIAAIGATGNVSVGLPDGSTTAASRTTLRFIGSLAQLNVGLITLDTSLLTGPGTVVANTVFQVGDLNQPWRDYHYATIAEVYAMSDYANYMILGDIDQLNGLRDGGFVTGVSSGPATWTVSAKYHSLTDGIHRDIGHPPYVAQLLDATLSLDGARLTRLGSNLASIP